MDRTGSKIGGERGYEPVRLELDPDPIPDRVKADEPPKPKTFFQRVKRFFQPVLDAFSNAFSSARDAILSVFFKRNISADPLKNIHEKPSASPTQMTESEPSTDWLEQPKTIYTFSGNSPAVAEPASTLESQPASMPAPLQEPPALGILGAILVNVPDPVQDVKIDPPGAKKFDCYVDTLKKGENVDTFVADPECVEFARKICEEARTFVHSGAKLDESKQSLVTAAKELVNAHADQKIRDREREERAVRDAEKLRKAELLASTAPGQLDFEEFVNYYLKHQNENTPFEIHEGSKYLSTDCLNYAKSIEGHMAGDQKAAWEYLQRWHREPEQARKIIKSSNSFVRLDAAEPDVAAELALDPSRQAPPSPPPLPVWKVKLRSIPEFSDSQCSRIGAVFAMTGGEIEKAFAGLRIVMTDASPDTGKTFAGAGSSQSIDYLLNYSAEASRRAQSTLESLELAKRLLDKVRDRDFSVLDNVSKDYLNNLKEFIRPVSSALERRLRELLPEQQAVHRRKVIVPALEALTEAQAAEGSQSFERYAKAYAALSNSPTYALPDKSPYFSRECLAYAAAFVQQVSMMPPGSQVDSMRLLASTYLLSEARHRGIADT